DGPEAGERRAAPDAPAPVVRLEATRRPGEVSRWTGEPPSGRRSVQEGRRGRLIGDRTPGPEGASTVAIGATVREAVARRAGGSAEQASPLVAPADVREAVREHRVGNLVILAVDASGSMGASQRMEAAKGAVLSLLVDAYERRDRVALVTFREEQASVVLRPTGSIEVARARLTELPTGGRTPLAAGIEAAAGLAGRVPTNGDGVAHRPLVVLVTDGRATTAPGGLDPVEAAEQAAAVLRRRRISAVVIDAEDGPARLGLARRLAEVMGARYLTVPELSAPSVVRAIRQAQGS
ncbi:MAG TPA: VWA domain-containing protein, partial [Acidimicrobiales bacterium]|nr:VWA domain-containing protein [Acidimicrobiales bacterium]